MGTNLENDKKHAVLLAIILVGVMLLTHAVFFKFLTTYGIFYVLTEIVTFSLCAYFCFIAIKEAPEGGADDWIFSAAWVSFVVNVAVVAAWHAIKSNPL